MTYSAHIGARVIEPGSAKGRGTVQHLKMTVGIEEAGVQWDNATLGHIDWVPVRNLIVMASREA